MGLFSEIKYLLYGSATAFVVVALVGLGFGSVGKASAQVFNSSGAGCSVSVLAPKANAFTVSGNMASTTVLVSGPANCRETVSLSSWNAPLGSPNFRPFANQQFVAGKTISGLGPGRHTLSIAVNTTCSFQVDILLGASQRSASGDANFGQAELMGFLQVNAGVCGKAKAPAQTPAAPAASTTINNTNTTVVQQQQQQNQTTPAATEATPTDQTTPTTPSQNQQQAATTPEVSAAQSQSQQPAETQPAKAQAVFTCDGIDITQNAMDNSVTINDFRQTANNGATFTSADIAWGDGTTAPGVTTVSGLSHQFNLNGANSGTFTISVVAHFNVNGQDVTAGGPNCQKQVTVMAAQTPAAPTPAPTTTTPVAPITPTTTAAPSQLVNTGPANLSSLLGIFGVSTFLGTLGFRYFLRARLSRM